MAVSVDTSSESHTGTTGSVSEASFTWNHLGGTPQGVLIFTMHCAAADGNTAVTYGGVALTAIPGAQFTKAAPTPGDVKAWLLDSGVPAGTQAVVVTRVNNVEVSWAVCISLNATKRLGIRSISGNNSAGTLVESTVNDGSPGTNSLRFGACNSGLNTAATAGASSTMLQSIDFGTRTAVVCQETTAGQGARNVGFSGGSDDRAAVYFAVVEEPSTNTGWSGAGTW